MTIDRIAFFSYSQYPSALEQYRIYSPLKQASIEIVPGIYEGQLDLNAIDQSHLVLFQRDFSRHFRDYGQILDLAQAHQKPVILDLDDHLLALPEDHPDRISGAFADRLPALLHALLNVDAITVTTPVLRQALLPYNSQIYVLPNYLDAELWQFREPKAAEDGAPVRILFMGTPTHQPDLELITQPLAHITQKYANQIAFIFFGVQPSSILQNAANVTYFPLHTYNYRDFLREFQQLEAEIAVAPLKDNLFNRSKSAIKYFEYTALGLPGVFSTLPPYAEVVHDGKDGFLAANPEEWERKLELLIESPELRLEMAQEAQQQVQQNWLIQDHANEWQEVYNQIIALGVQQSQVDPSINSAITALAAQLEEYHNIVNLETLNLKDNQIQKLSVENEGLQLEIVDYASSTSWKITRPLRRLSRLVRRK